MKIYNSLLNVYEDPDVDIVVNLLLASAENDSALQKAVVESVLKYSLEERVVDNLFSKPNYKSLKVLMTLQKTLGRSIYADPDVYNSFVDTVKSRTPREKLQSLRTEP